MLEFKFRMKRNEANTLRASSTLKGDVMFCNLGKAPQFLLNRLQLIYTHSPHMHDIIMLNQTRMAIIANTHKATHYNESSFSRCVAIQIVCKSNECVHGNVHIYLHFPVYNRYFHFQFGIVPLLTSLWMRQRERKWMKVKDTAKNK